MGVAKHWDDTIKRLIKENPQHFVSWILRDALLKDALSVELKNKTLESDILLEVTLNDKSFLLHIEFQSRKDKKIAQRLLEYNVLATHEHNRSVYSCVIYLRPGKNISEPPLVWTIPDGQEMLRFHFGVIKMWEISSEEIIQTGLSSLLPLLPLTRDGKQYEVIDEMVERIVATGQYHLISWAKAFAGLVFDAKDDQEWLKRRFAVYQDILDESWIIQEKKLEGKLEVLHSTIPRMVQARFPELLEVTKNKVAGVTDPEPLENLLFTIALAQGVNEVLRVLAEFKSPQQNT